MVKWQCPVLDLGCAEGVPPAAGEQGTAFCCNEPKLRFSARLGERMGEEIGM